MVSLPSDFYIFCTYGTFQFSPYPTTAGPWPPLLRPRPYLTCVFTHDTNRLPLSDVLFTPFLSSILCVFVRPSAGFPSSTSGPPGPQPIAPYMCIPTRTPTRAYPTIKSNFLLFHFGLSYSFILRYGYSFFVLATGRTTQYIITATLSWSSIHDSLCALVLLHSPPAAPPPPPVPLPPPPSFSSPWPNVSPTPLVVAAADVVTSTLASSSMPPLPVLLAPTVVLLMLTAAVPLLLSTPCLWIHLA